MVFKMKAGLSVLVALSLTACFPTSNDGEGENNTPDNTTDNTTDNSSAETPQAQFVVVDTNQSQCYRGNGNNITCGANFVGQDAEYTANAPSYTDNGDDTVTDNNTGLMWSAITINDVSYHDADTTAENSTHAGYSDWRVPSIKELYSLMDFSGATGSGDQNSSTAPNDAIAFINTTFFDMEYASTGTRFIDAQYITSTIYVDKIFDDNSDANAGQEGFFGVNFADGRIKGYPTTDNPGSSGWNLRLVRGTESFENDFIDNNDATITDAATGLMWMEDDSGTYSGVAGTQGDGSLDWVEALDWCETLSYASYDDWRLPNAKEMQSLVDYSRSPDTTGSAAIDPLFTTSTFLDPDGSNINYPYYWTSTTHVEGDATKSVYIAFGEAQGRFNMTTQSSGPSETLLDVHGAGAQRSDPKITGGGTYPDFQGPQGDVRYVYNYARCVRN